MTERIRGYAPDTNPAYPNGYADTNPLKKMSSYSLVGWNPLWGDSNPKHSPADSSYPKRQHQRLTPMVHALSVFRKRLRMRPLAAYSVVSLGGAVEKFGA